MLENTTQQENNRANIRRLKQDIYAKEILRKDEYRRKIEEKFYEKRNLQENEDSLDYFDGEDEVEKAYPHDFTPNYDGQKDGT